MTSEPGGAFERYRETRYFPSLDGLRALSILPIIWHHCSLRPLPGLLGKGPAAVQLFFVISGYLVTTLLLREREVSGVDLPRFYARRALRIFPLYYLVLALVTAHTVLSPPSPARTHFLDSLPYYVSYTSNWWVDFRVPHPVIFGFAWTLAIEEQFYVLWPPALRFLRSLWAPTAFALTLLALSEVVTWEPLSAGFPEGSFLRTVCLGLSSSIALGCLSALLLHSRRGFSVARASFGAWWSAPLALGACVVCLLAEVNHLVFHSALCAWLVSCVVEPNHGLSKLLNSRVLVHVGRASYALYLTHFVAVGAARRIVDPERPWLVFLLALPLALGLAELAHRFVELPFLRLKARFGPQNSTRARNSRGSPLAPRS